MRVASLADRVLAALDIFATLDNIESALDLDPGELQSLIEETPADGVLALTTGVARGTTIAVNGLHLICDDAPGVFLVSGDQPALIVDAPGEVVTLRNVTLDADSRFGTLLVLSGDVRLERCVVAGRIAILLGPDAGAVTIVDSRVGCPSGGCGIVAASGEALTIERVWIGVHRGIGILDLAGAVAAASGVDIVGDDVAALHSAEWPS